MRLIIFGFLFFVGIDFLFIVEADERLIGRWKLTSYDAIDAIRLSQGYLFADEANREKLEKTFEMTFDSTFYEFGGDTLKYTSVELDDVVHRRAIWKLLGDTLMIKEIDRIYFRKALVRSVSEDELVFSPIINDVAGEHKMTFERVR